MACNREGAKAAGWSDAEIDAHLASRARSVDAEVVTSPVTAAASDLAVRGITLPLRNPIMDRLTTAANRVESGVRDVAGRVAESGSPLTASLMSLGAEFGNLSPENVAINLGGEALGRIAVPIAARAAGRGIAHGEGLLTGSQDAILEAARAGEVGGKAQKALIDTMRGTRSERAVAKDALDSLRAMKQTRAVKYRAKMDEIQSTPFQKKIDLSPIKEHLDDLLDRYNIVRSKDGGLDFSRATVDDPSAADIERMAKTVDSWGTKAGDNTVKGLDILKRRIDDFYSPSSEARAFTSSLRNNVKSTITEAVPEYQKLTRGYEKATEVIDDISAELSLGPNAKAGTITRKLKQTLRQNFDLRRDFVEELDKAGKRNLIEQIAGVELMPLMPKGLSRIIAGGTAVTAPFANPMALLSLPSMSPRLIGEAALKVGQAARLIEPATRTIRKAPLTSPLSIAARIAAQRNGER